MSPALRANSVSLYLRGWSSVSRSIPGLTKGSFHAGYQVKPWVDGKIRVDYTLGSHKSGTPQAQAAEKRKGLDALLMPLRWTYQTEDHGSYLVVTGKKAEPVTELGPQAVSVHLGKAAKQTGVKRSEYSTTRIKGWGRWTEGYEVKKTYLGITVDFNWSSSHHYKDGDAARKAAKMEALKVALETKYTVTWGTRGNDMKVLVVTKK